MGYGRFEDLPVWQASMDLAEHIFLMTEDKAFAYKGDIRSQLQRAVLSISNNVAEGFERGTTQELITFVYIARGSAGEVRSILCLLERLCAFQHLKGEVVRQKAMAEGISRQLRAWADSLQNTQIRGQRYLTRQTRQQTQQAKESKAFWDGIQKIVDRKVEEMQENAAKSHSSEPNNPPGKQVDDSPGE